MGDYKITLKQSAVGDYEDVFRVIRNAYLVVDGMFVGFHNGDGKILKAFPADAILEIDLIS